MAAPGGRFFIQDRLTTPAIHHESFEQLWKTKWQMPSKKGVYPFMFSKTQDFEPIVEQLIKNGFEEPYDWDEYAQTFFPKAEELVAEAEKAEKEGNKSKASEFYLRASSIYRIARFPIPRSPSQHQAWTQGKLASARGLLLRPRSTNEIIIPHKFRSLSPSSLDGPQLTFYFHLPPSASPSNPVPLIVILTGLDGYRTELAVWIEGWSRKNVGVVILEIPGTGDSPADPGDPTSQERVWETLFEWIEGREEIDQARKAVWGFSTGGYYAIRVAHTHHERVKGVVALGGGCHYMFLPEWLESVNRLEYPFDLANALAWKWSYGEDLEGFKREGMGKFSLLENGILDGEECARLLLVNGVEDEIFPIDDYYLCLMHGAPKEVRFVDKKKHMGEPESFSIILTWLYKLLGLEGDPADQLKTIPFRAEY